MRLLILGGTVFLGREIARQARALGHDVTCAARGVSGSPAEGVRFVPLDRDKSDTLAPLTETRYDAVLDVTSRPGHARAALARLAPVTDHWCFVSTITVYSDVSTPGQRPDTAPVLAPAPPELDDPAGDAARYGACKVACEQAVLETVGHERALLCRPGLIVGPGDPTDRFSYWVERIARGGRLLAPGDPDEPVQYVDVRDLARWLVAACDYRLTGVYDAIGAPLPRREFLDGIATGVGTSPAFTWVDQAFLRDRQVRPFAGPRSLPFWVPVPEYAGLLTHDATPAREAGLPARPVADTAADTLAWRRARGSDRPAANAVGQAGVTAEEEAALLADWDATHADS